MAELKCDTRHLTIQDAIRCAERNLGMRGRPARPYWGARNDNSHLIVGFQVSPQKRWRLDYDPDKGTHLNEENFDAEPGHQKILHKIG